MQISCTSQCNVIISCCRRVAYVISAEADSKRYQYCLVYASSLSIVRAKERDRVTANALGYCLRHRNL